MIGVREHRCDRHRTIGRMRIDAEYDALGRLRQTMRRCRHRVGRNHRSAALNSARRDEGHHARMAGLLLSANQHDEEQQQISRSSEH